MRPFHPLVALIPLLLAAGCDDPGIAGDREPVAFRPGGYGCSVCGIGLGNSASVNGNAIPEFSLDGTANAAGVWLAGGHTFGGQNFVVSIDPDTDTWIGIGSDETVEGEEFEGATLEWRIPGGAVYVTIDEVDTVASWAEGGAPVAVYRASYKDKNGQAASICPGATATDQWFTLVHGELYDRTTNEVTGGMPEWVTMACMTEAVAKVKMLGYHGMGVAQASVAETQATLRMITADYCGTGQSFTTGGVAVAWRDARRLVEPPFAEAEIEAKWGPNGAICLDNPRYASSEELADSCAIPSCNGDSLFTTGVVWRTMLP